MPDEVAGKALIVGKRGAKRGNLFACLLNVVFADIGYPRRNSGEAVGDRARFCHGAQRYSVFFASGVVQGGGDTFTRTSDVVGNFAGAVSGRGNRCHGGYGLRARGRADADPIIAGEHYTPARMYAWFATKGIQK